MPRPTRRDFLKTASAAGAAVAVPYIITSKALGDETKAPASERIVMAGIGIGNMGSGDQGHFAGRKDVQYVAACDVRKSKRDESKNRVDGKNNNKDCKLYADFREVLARPDIDAVHIATPDHWHALIAIEACKAGKDVYCQKPESLTLREGPLMVAAARRYGRVFSGGSQRVLEDYRKLSVDKCWGGELGPIKSINVNENRLPHLCNLPAQPANPDIDWEMWLGPAPWGPYNADRCSGSYDIAKGNCWRAFRDYSGGGLTDWGAHHIGGATFAVDVRELQPTGVEFMNDKGNKWLQFTYPNGILLTVNKPGVGNHAVEGTPGEKRAPKPVPGYKGEGGIYGDFIDCVKTREKPFRDIELAINTVTVCHMANIAYELEKSLKWDAAKQEFPGDEEANRFLDRARREPWVL